MFSPKDMDLPRGWPGRVDGDRVIQLAAQTLQAFFSGGGTAREHAEYPLAEVELRPPVLQPPSVRVFGPEGLGFAFSNPAAIAGPEADIPYPAGTEELDYGAGLAAVIGADERIGGFTIVNDWAARDLGDGKATDFATSLGPVVVTPDGQVGPVVARVNGEDCAQADVRPAWERLVEHAACNTRLLPGDLIACVAPHPPGAWLRPGDVVELETEGIGVLRNAIV